MNDVTPKHSPAIERLLEEVRHEQQTPAGAYDRGHFRHNRSMGHDPEGEFPSPNPRAAGPCQIPKDLEGQDPDEEAPPRAKPGTQGRLYEDAESYGYPD
jgi:hypothetical protein